MNRKQLKQMKKHELIKMVLELQEKQYEPILTMDLGVNTETIEPTLLETVPFPCVDFNDYEPKPNSLYFKQITYLKKRISKCRDVKQLESYTRSLEKYVLKSL